MYELTGPKSQDMNGVAAEYSAALGEKSPMWTCLSEQWRDQELRKLNLPEQVFEHILTMARLHAANRYDRITHDVETITGRPALSIRDFVAQTSICSDQFGRPGVDCWTPTRMAPARVSIT